MTDVIDILAAIAYYVVPVELLGMFMFYPHLARMPRLMIGMVILFAIFTLSCGTMHLLRGIGKMDTLHFKVANACTAVSSLLSALYLIPLFPRILSVIDRYLRETREFNRTLMENSRKNDAFASFLYHELQGPLNLLTEGNKMIDAPKQSALYEQIRNLTELLIDPEIMYCELHRQIRVVCSAVKHQVSLRGTNNASYCNDVDFQYNIASEIPQRLMGNRQILGQILYNLLSIGVASSNRLSTSGTQRLVLVGLKVILIEWKAAAKMGFVHESDNDSSHRQVICFIVSGLRDFQTGPSDHTLKCHSWLNELAKMLKGTVAQENGSSGKTLCVYLPVSLDDESSTMTVGVVRSPSSAFEH